LPPRREAVRGTSVRLRRSLRTRVLAACVAAFLAISFLLCFVVPRSFRAVAVESLRERTRSMAVVAAFQLRHAGGESLLDAARALEGELDFESLALLHAEGRPPAVGPKDAPGWDAPVRWSEQLEEKRDHFLAIAPIAAGTSDWIAVRTSTVRLQEDVRAVAALLFALLLVTGSALLALAGYLLRAVLAPLEDIRVAARHLAGEESGDGEIDELGELIAKLGDDARRREAEAVLALIPRRGASLPRIPGEERRSGDPRTPGIVPE
jgi:hypothetical protein